MQEKPKGQRKISLKTVMEEAVRQVAESPPWLKEIYRRNEVIAKILAERGRAPREPDGST